MKGSIVLAELDQATPVVKNESKAGTCSPRVSVIVPCYKTARFVAETLQSVFAQTYRNFEVVLINDGSPDTPELEKAISPWRDNITYLHTENCGLAGARNNGIRASKGELIALLDSDDTWEPNYLEVQVQKLDADPTADIVYPRVLNFVDGVSGGLRSKPCQGDVTFVRLAQRQITVVVSVLARRSALERVGLFDDSLRSCEDFDMWLRCVKNGSRIIYHDKVLLRYRVRPDSLSADPAWMHGNAARVLKKMLASVTLTNEERKAIQSAVEQEEGFSLFFEGKRAFLNGDFSSAIDLIEQSNVLLKHVRISAILIALRTAPRLCLKVYTW
jgi:glycosyltransferase involved in cell wall biosynthesis